jgi:hypothetical protein
MTEIRKWGLALWALNILDWISTRAFIVSGRGVEGNPLLAGWIEGVYGFGVKVFGTAAIIAVMVWAHGEKERVSSWVKGVTAFYVMVILWNLTVWL